MLLLAPAFISKPISAEAMSLSIKQTAGILKKAGFKDAEIPIMVAIGIGESGLDPKAHNPPIVTGKHQQAQVKPG